MSVSIPAITMHYTIPSIVVLASVAAAVPTPEQQADQWKGVIDPWGQYGRKPESAKRSIIDLLDDSTTNSTNFRINGLEYSPDEPLKLAKRATIKDFVGKIPGCDDDPSIKNTPKPKWSVNEGVRIPKNKGDNDDACGSGHNANHCWTEYYLVEAAIEYFSWLPTGSAANCPAGPKDSCSIAVSSLAQSCSITGTTSSKGYDWKIIEASAKLPIKFDKWGLKSTIDLTGGMGISKKWETTDHHLTNACRQDSSTATCTWNNDGTEKKSLCHQVWYADRVLHIWGQAQRVCNKCGNADNVQQQTGDGTVCVRGQKEFDFLLPINKLVQCDGACGINDPGVTQPANEQRGRYVAPNNWDLLVIGA